MTADRLMWRMLTALFVALDNIFIHTIMSTGGWVSAVSMLYRD